MEKEHVTCIRIEMEFSDGELLRATGEDAEKIQNWINGATLMNHIHGIDYTGPKMEKVEK
jgi:hypothetical protein